MKALITGASGFVGSHLTPKVYQKGYDVRVLLLPGEKNPFPRLPLEIVYGNILDSSSLKQAFVDVDIVFHLAAYVGDMNGFGKYDEFIRLNVDGLRNVLEQAKSANVKKFIHVSSIAAVGKYILGRDVDEYAPRELAGYGYGDSKAKGEELVEKSGIPYVIALPTLIIGERDSVVFRGIAVALEGKRFSFIGESNVIWSLIYAGDVADALLFLAKKEEALGQIYNLSNGEEVPYRELVYAIADDLGLEKPKKEIPLWFALFLARLSVFSEQVLKRDPIISMAQIEPMRHDMHASARKITSLGFQPKVSWREAIRLTANWWKQRKEM
jgi:nucleoside-diphosphate-sugar epimerase